MTAPDLSPSLPRVVAPTARLYLRPAGLVGGAEAQALIEAGQALPLCGGPLAFTFCEVVLREEGGRGRCILAPAQEVRAWAEGLEQGHRRRARTLFEGLTASRPGLLGLALDRPLIMGILNVTPDSFSDGGDHAEPAQAIRRGRELAAAGADILDVGGESTRPGADPVPLAQELDRVLPVVEGLKDLGLPLSVDTRHARVMTEAVAAGAAMINDVSALEADAGSLAAAAAADVPVVLMHSRGEPGTMQGLATYTDVLLDVHDALEARLEASVAAGIDRARLIVDPGLGFAKTAAHNLAVLAGVALFHGLGAPLMLGASRKLGKARAGAGPKGKLPGALATAFWGLSQGVHILRVHDVAETRQAIGVWRALAGCDSSRVGAGK